MMELYTFNDKTFVGIFLNKDICPFKPCQNDPDLNCFFQLSMQFYQYHGVRCLESMRFSHSIYHPSNWGVILEYCQYFNLFNKIISLFIELYN
jgi:hypothetical protein